MGRLEKENRRIKKEEEKKLKKDPIMGLGLFVTGIFILISLFTFSNKDSFTSAYNNWGGIIGHFTSFYLYNFFGIVAYIFPLLLFIWGFVVITGKQRRKTLYNSFLVLTLGLLLELTLVHFVNFKIFQKFSLGGKIGEFIHKYCVLYVGRTGTLLLLIFLYLVLIILLLNINLEEIFVRLSEKMKEKRKKEKKIPEPRVSLEPISEKKSIPEEKPSSIQENQEKAIEIDISQNLKDYLYSRETKYEISEREIKEKAKLLKKKLKEFGIAGEVTEVITGPVITRYEFNPAPGVKISKITSFEKDLALALKAERIRILAPIPGKSAIGIEIPNEQRKTVYLGEIVKSLVFEQAKAPLTFALGVTITGEPYMYPLSEIPHILIAGTTGSGKSVCIHSLVTSMVIRESWENLRFIMIDPKRLELPVYNLLPHLLYPVVMDPKNSVPALETAIKIMEERYKEFSKEGVRDIQSYNKKCPDNKKPYIVIIVDELADLMLTAPSEVERSIIRLAQMSRAVGIHLVLATQRPSVDVITGLIKANFPGRIAFQVASKTDSRTILDMNGAESLLGKGDMLFLPPGKGEPVRLHGAFVSREEVKKITEHIGFSRIVYLLSQSIPLKESKEIASVILNENLFDAIIFPEESLYKAKKEKLIELIGEKGYKLLAENYYPSLPELKLIEEQTKYEKPLDKIDPLFIEAARLVISHGEASVSMLQRRLRIGYARAGYIIDQLERAGIVGPHEGSKSRKVLIETEEELEKILKKLGIR